jgi:arginyl-tRNA synthetase
VSTVSQQQKPAFRGSAPSGGPQHDLVGLCERLLVEHDATRRCVLIERPRQDEDRVADLRLRFGDGAWLESPDGVALVDAFRAHPAVSSATLYRSSLLLQFADDALAELERQLAAGAMTGMHVEDLLADGAFIVSFVGPNTNKALHIGHLRNIVLGHAIASTLRAAGASVERRSLVGDIGYRVCKAMLGYRSNYDGETPQSSGVRGDRFVELCTRAFADDGAEAAGRRQSSEADMAGWDGPPELTDLMQRWQAGAEPERALWARMREWVLAEHEATLARLGVRLDTHDFESSAVQNAHALIASGLDQGLFTRDATGEVIYRSGRSEYATMVLLTKDGVPTECARVLSVCHRVIEALDPDVGFIELLGTDWQPAQTVIDELLRVLVRSPERKDFRRVYHAMVTAEGRKIESSNGEPIWIDDLLDELAASDAVRALHERAGGAVSCEELADIVVRGTFLCAPMAQPLPFAPERLLAAEAGAGWTIAEAWCRASRASAGAGAVRPVAARGAIVESQLFRRALRGAVTTRDPVRLASYLLRLSEAFLIVPDPGPAAAPVLRRVLESLGFQVRDPEAVSSQRASSVRAPVAQSVESVGLLSRRYGFESRRACSSDASVIEQGDRVGTHVD